MTEKALYNKVPQITILFWITKVITTGMGESISDWSLDLVGKPTNQNTGALFTFEWSGLLLAICLFQQFSADRYHPVSYWLSVASLAVFGTVFADSFKAATGLTHFETTALFIILMVGSFIGWSFTTHDLSVHHITNHKAEFFYWLTVTFSFMLGTAAGDWLAKKHSSNLSFIKNGLGLGLLNTGLLLAIITIIIIAFRIIDHTTSNGPTEIITFWGAYILTRPIGASFADYFGYKFDGGILDNQGMSELWVIGFLFCLGLIVREAPKYEDSSISSSHNEQNNSAPGNGRTVIFYLDCFIVRIKTLPLG